MTSHDVVALVRRRLQIRKVGHCGTLDPIATGLLLLTLGRGTKIQDLLMAEDKEYSGTMMFGVTTSTQDKEGEIIEQREVPALDEKNIRPAFEKFRGDFLSNPANGLRHQIRRCSTLQTRTPGKNSRTRAAVSARLPLLHRSNRFTQSRFHRCLQQRFLCSNLRTRHWRGTRLRRASLFAPTSEIGAIRCRERGLGRSDQKWRPARNCRACAFVAAGFRMREREGNDEARMTNDEGSPNDELQKDA